VKFLAVLILVRFEIVTGRIHVGFTMGKICIGLGFSLPNLVPAVAPEVCDMTGQPTLYVHKTPT
jgi:hypothetical protein